MVKNDSILQQTHNLKSQIDIHPKKKKNSGRQQRQTALDLGFIALPVRGEFPVYFKEETRQLDCEGDEDQLHI